eukprot:SAG11_NODE_792_length_7143_cov_38.103492_2_plen_111_part_00
MYHKEPEAKDPNDEAPLYSSFTRDNIFPELKHGRRSSKGGSFNSTKLRSMDSAGGGGGGGGAQEFSLAGAGKIEQQAAATASGGSGGANVSKQSLAHRSILVPTRRATYF